MPERDNYHFHWGICNPFVVHRINLFILYLECSGKYSSEIVGKFVHRLLFYTKKLCEIFLRTTVNVVVDVSNIFVLHLVWFLNIINTFIRYHDPFYREQSKRLLRTEMKCNSGLYEMSCCHRRISKIRFKISEWAKNRHGIFNVTLTCRRWNTPYNVHLKCIFIVNIKAEVKPWIDDLYLESFILMTCSICITSIIQMFSYISDFIRFEYIFGFLNLSVMV